MARKPGAFWTRVDRSNKNGCWPWIGARTSLGYGQVWQPNGRRATKRTIYAHRISYEMCVGPIPAGLNVLHRCDNPSCVRPDHLFVGTQADNMTDKVAKGRARGNAKLDKLKVAAIRKRHRNGETQAALAKHYHVTQSTISRIVNGKRWK